MRLGDYITLQRGFDITRAQQEDGLIPVVSSSGINSFHSKAMVDGPGVVIGRKGSLGTCFYIEGAYWPHDTTLWVKDFKGNDPRFCYYLLKSLDLAKYDVGAANPTLNRNHAHLLPVTSHDHDNQRRIASILGAYDDLIEVNRRRIAVLEEMARLLFDEWFVYFRFPGHQKLTQVACSVGDIPQGWEVRTVGEVVKRVPVGKKYDQKTVSTTGTVPVLDQGKTGIIGYHDDEPGVTASGTSPVVVFANHTCYQRLVHFPFSAIQNVLPFVPSPTLSRNIYWLHWATNGLITLNDYKGHWPEFTTKKLVVPRPDVCQQFGDFVAPLSLQVQQLDRANENLRRTGALLLPRLISGDLSAMAAERELADAA